jgi:hypothetical protein
MTPPPTLNYASPPPPPRGLAAAFVFLLTLGTLYAGAVLLFFSDVPRHDSASAFGYLLFFFAVGSATLFITAAIRIRRHSRRWTLIAFIATLSNLVALLSCLGYAAVVGGFNNNPVFMFGCCISIVPFGILTIQAQLLFTLLRDFNRSP